ncbi:peptidase S41, partial [candidate division WWE3 bacterium CG_4_10_14_0_2_um_filter_42_7]
TSFLTPDQNDSFSQGLAGEYEGVGIELGMKNESLLIIAPLEGSPAEKSGIQAGDLIQKINDKETAGMSLTNAVSIIRGKEGTKITLTLLHEGEKEYKDYEITRAKILVPSVTWKDAGEGIVQLRLSRFGDTTNREWRDTVDEILQKRPGLKGIVLDLRGNPGGYLSGSVFVVSEFVSAGKTVLIEEFADMTRKEVKTEFSGKLLNVPTVILIDGGSASSSEIVAAALRNLKKFKVVGVNSFGKGTIQDAEDFSDGSGIHITVAKWLDPDGNWYHEIGIEPDVAVEVDKAKKEEGIDNQLEKAVERLK